MSAWGQTLSRVGRSINLCARQGLKEIRMRQRMIAGLALALAAAILPRPAAERDLRARLSDLRLETATTLRFATAGLSLNAG